MGSKATASRRYVDLGVFALAVGGVIGVWNVASHNRELRAALVATGLRADEAAVRDRLVGARVTLPFLSFDEPDAAEAHLLWIVDLERCPACLASASPAWSALGEDASLRRHLVLLEGGKMPQAARWARRGTTVTSVSAQEAHAAFGSLLPSTKLLVDGRGIVLMADSRASVSECDWSFEAQVGALRGTLATGVIRNQHQP